MGLTHVTTTVRDLLKQRTSYEAEFLVGTGAIDSMAPAGLLAAAGVKPERSQHYELANGQQVEFELGFARVTVQGEETVTPMIFGPEDAEPILGVVTLESLGMVVDPVTNTLTRMHAKPLK